jgi:hypothetical protein
MDETTISISAENDIETTFPETVKLGVSLHS